MLDVQRQLQDALRTVKVLSDGTDRAMSVVSDPAIWISCHFNVQGSPCRLIRATLTREAQFTESHQPEPLRPRRRRLAAQIRRPAARPARRNRSKRESTHRSRRTKPSGDGKDRAKRLRYGRTTGTGRVLRAGIFEVYRRSTTKSAVSALSSATNAATSSTKIRSTAASFMPLVAGAAQMHCGARRIKAYRMKANRQRLRSAVDSLRARPSGSRPNASIFTCGSSSSMEWPEQAYREPRDAPVQEYKVSAIPKSFVVEP